jgi:antitoxin component YwqK of YwqJK toxin-antitoxin module
MSTNYIFIYKKNNYENGRIESKGSYKMDKPFGNWLGFEENGTLEYTELTVKLPEAK